MGSPCVAAAGPAARSRFGRQQQFSRQQARAAQHGTEHTQLAQHTQRPIAHLHQAGGALAVDAAGGRQIANLALRSTHSAHDLHGRGVRVRSGVLDVWPLALTVASCTALPIQGPCTMNQLRSLLGDPAAPPAAPWQRRQSRGQWSQGAPGHTQPPVWSGASSGNRHCLCLFRTSRSCRPTLYQHSILTCSRGIIPGVNHHTFLRRYTIQRRALHDPQSRASPSGAPAHPWTAGRTRRQSLGRCRPFQGCAHPRAPAAVQRMGAKHGGNAWGQSMGAKHGG